MYGAQEIYLRKQHMDEKVLIDAGRKKASTNSKLHQIKKNRGHRLKQIQEEKNKRNARFEAQRIGKIKECERKRREVYEKKKADNDAHYAHIKFRIELAKKQSADFEEEKYRKLAKKYIIRFNEQLPRPPAEVKPITLYSMVDRSGGSGVSSPSPRARRPLTAPSCAYVPTAIGHKSRNADDVQNRRDSNTEKMKKIVEEVNLRRRIKQEALHAKHKKNREDQDAERKFRMEEKQELKAYHLLTIASKKEQEMAERHVKALEKQEKAAQKREMLVLEYKQIIEARVKKAVYLEMRGHRLKDEYDEQLWEICRAQADVIRGRIARAANRRVQIDKEIQMEKQLRATQNSEMRENRVIAASARRQKLLEEQRQKHRAAVEAHSERLNFILETIAMEEERKKLRSEQKWKEIEERVAELQSRRKLRTNLHMGNTCYHRQYVVDDYAVPLNPVLIEVDEVSNGTERLCDINIPDILTTPKA